MNELIIRAVKSGLWASANEHTVAIANKVAAQNIEKGYQDWLGSTVHPLFQQTRDYVREHLGVELAIVVRGDGMWIGSDGSEEIADANLADVRDEKYQSFFIVSLKGASAVIESKLWGSTQAAENIGKLPATPRLEDSFSKWLKGYAKAVADYRIRAAAGPPE